MTPEQNSRDDPAQSQRFLDMAREVEAGDPGAEVEATFAAVAALPRETPKKAKVRKASRAK